MNNISPFSIPSSAADLPKSEQWLRDHMVLLSGACARKGYTVNPFRESNWVRFRTLPMPTIQKICANFSAYYEIYERVLAQEGSPNEESRLTWSALRKYQLLPCEGFFEQITEEDIIEFYDSNGVQIFHNTNFFDVCNYTLAEVFTYDFSELWNRDASLVQEIWKVATQAFSGQLHKVVDANIPEHILVERFSDSRSTISLRFRKFAPLFHKDGRVGALASVSRGRIIDSVGVERSRLLPKEGPRSHLTIVT